MNTIPDNRAPIPAIRRLLTSVAFVLGVCLNVPQLALAEIYYYLDAGGTFNATNAPSDSRFRTDGTADRMWAPVQIKPQEFDQAIRWHARKQRLSPALLRAIIKAESDFNPRAVSPARAIGLMQLMPRTAAALNIHDPFNPVENIRGGAAHLRYLLDRFQGNLPLAIAAYNAGEYRVKRCNYQIPPIQETQDYVEKVLAYYEAFQSKKRNHAGAKRIF